MAYPFAVTTAFYQPFYFWYATRRRGSFAIMGDVKERLLVWAHS
jgi:hypothetical protein